MRSRGVEAALAPPLTVQNRGGFDEVQVTSEVECGFSV